MGRTGRADAVLGEPQLLLGASNSLPTQSQRMAPLPVLLAGAVLLSRGKKRSMVGEAEDQKHPRTKSRSNPNPTKLWLLLLPPGRLADHARGQITRDTVWNSRQELLLRAVDRPLNSSSSIREFNTLFLFSNQSRSLDPKLWSASRLCLQVPRLQMLSQLHPCAQNPHNHLHSRPWLHST